MLEKYTAFKSKIVPKLPIFILIYCVLQPLLDVVGFWQMKLEVSNVITTGIRIILLVASVFLGFLLSDRKRYYFGMAAVLLVLTAFHVYANLPEYDEWMTDLSNLVRIYLMPLTTLCFITFLRQGGDKAFRAMKLGMVVNLVVIAVVELLSVLTKTDPHTYWHEGIGVLGWFYWANSQSAILSIIAPISVCWAIGKWPKRILPTLLAALFSSALLYFFGTRLAFGTMVLSNACISICLLIMNRQCWKQALVVGLVAIAFTAAIKYSPMNARFDAVDDRQAFNQEVIESIDVETLPIDPEETGHSHGPNLDKANKEKMDKIYYGYVSGVIHHFGYDRVEAAYNYTLDAGILGNWRTYKLVFCELLMEDAGPMQHLFGLNLMDMREFVEKGIYNPETRTWEDGYIIMDVENDFHGIYFLLGVVGIVLMVAFLLYFGLRALLRIIRSFKTYFTVDMIGFVGAYGFGLLHAYFTVSVLRRNNASVYMALVLAGLWYLSRKELQTKRAELSADSAK